MTKTNTFRVLHEAEQRFYLQRKFVTFTGREVWKHYYSYKMYSDGMQRVRFYAYTKKEAIQEAVRLVKDESFVPAEFLIAIAEGRAWPVRQNGEKE